jgi:hypothetical protein
MRFALLFTLSLSCLSVVWAQSPDQTTKPVPSASISAPKQPVARAEAVEKRSEHIQVEDSGARIDELRVGGETRSIEVKPKGDMPAYQVEPTSGERSWKILGF